MATARQDRTFLPPDFCPRCPTKNGDSPTKVPGENYNIVAFENKFPSLKKNEQPAVASTDIYAVRGKVKLKNISIQFTIIFLIVYRQKIAAFSARYKLSSASPNRTFSFSFLSEANGSRHCQ